MDYREMNIAEAPKLAHIDRSEAIECIYTYRGGQLEAKQTGHEAPGWDDEQLRYMISRYSQALEQGGTAIGAFDGERLAGFAVLAHDFRGIRSDMLQLDLMYVSRSYRRRGIATRLMSLIREAAQQRGVKYLYISSTETNSAVGFYKSSGADVTDEVDEELYGLEPNDIHMVLKL